MNDDCVTPMTVNPDATSRSSRKGSASDEERVAFLDRACADDKDLRPKNRGFAQVQCTSRSFLEQPPAAQ